MHRRNGEFSLETVCVQTGCMCIYTRDQRGLIQGYSKVMLTLNNRWDWDFFFFLSSHVNYMYDS